MLNSNFEKKYLKYKNKYINFKNKRMIGGMHIVDDTEYDLDDDNNIRKISNNFLIS